MRILILGGTGEGRKLADALVSAGHDVTTSLAGRTDETPPVAGKTVSGGFGGAVGLMEYLLAENVDFLLDATHPFTVRMSANAVEAAQMAGIPLLRVTRPAWAPTATGSWTHAERAAVAADLLPPDAHVLLTTGHRDLDVFAARADCVFVVRLIQKPGFALPNNCTLIQDRPPYSVEQEVALMRAHAISHLVTKNSGGEQTRAKIDAAEAVGVSVIMIDRPRLVEAREVATVDEAVAAVQEAAS